MKLIGTSFVGAARGRVSEVPTSAIDPARGLPLEPAYHWATPAEIEHAATLAAAASESFVRSPAALRAKLLRAIAEGIETNAAAIVERGTQETALPAARLQGEVGRTCGQLRLFALLVEEGSWVDARIDRADPSRSPLPKPDVRSMLMGIGPVAVFSSSNFPLAFSVAGGDTASALAAGCPVIVKPHQGHLGTSELVGSIVRQAVSACELHEGTFSLLYGPGRTVGMALVRHPAIKAVGFTGSRAGGRALMDAAAARPEPIPIFAEMGSINPVFLLPDALRSRSHEIAKGLHASVTLGVGQFCTNPGIVFCPAGETTDAFLEELTKLMRATAPGAMLTPSICEEYANGVERLVATSGVSCLVRAVNASEGVSYSSGAPGLFTTDGATFLATPGLMEEVFGPSTLVVRTQSDEELLRCAHALEGQLTATIHADADSSSVTALAQVLASKAGRLVFNGFPTGVEVCHAMHHGGPYPATSEGRSTSVGTRAIARFSRPVCYQNFPSALLPDPLKEDNPLGLWRLKDGNWGRH